MRGRSLRYWRIKPFLRIGRQVISRMRTCANRFILDMSLEFSSDLYSYLIVSNNVTSQKDGTGAQIQRMLAVASLANVINVPFVQNDIVDVAVHPLDPFQNSHSYQSYLRKLNKIFELQNRSTSTHNAQIKHLRVLHLSSLIKFAIWSSVRKKHILLVVDSPYPVSDLNVNSYKKVIANLGATLTMESTLIPKPFIAIHYRQGVGNFAIYPGQSLSREIELDYFRIQIQESWAGKDFDNLVVHVFTDAPESKLLYRPPVDQQYLWEGSPGFVDGVLEIQPLTFTASGLGVRDVVIHSGGDPVDAIISMSQASLLILGRSSLSYVAGLLNQNGLVVAAPDFWHPPLSHWKKN
jgi:hypothetical protein